MHISFLHGNAENFLFLSAAQPTDQREENVVLLVGVRGDCFQTAHVQVFKFFGVCRAKTLSQKGCEKPKTLSQQGCEKGKLCLGCCTSWSMGMSKNYNCPLIHAAGQ